MNRNGIGAGSASIVLVFFVLCLSVFTVISLSTAISDRTMTDTALQMAVGYYEADARAEGILAEILESKTVPDSVDEIELFTNWDQDKSSEVVSFSCPVSDSKELYVETIIGESSAEILAWQMRDVGQWEANTELPVWPGNASSPWGE